MPNFLIKTKPDNDYQDEYITHGTVQDGMASIFFTTEDGEEMEIESSEVLSIEAI